MLDQNTVVIAGDAQVARARRMAQEAMRGRSEEAVYAAELVISELVTNALLHAGTEAAVAVLPLDQGARIEVRDGSRLLPVTAPASAETMTGRGLRLVAELAARWGAEPAGNGKVVWAEILDNGRDIAARTEEELLAAWGDEFEEVDDLKVRVSLGEVPTSLLVAAKRHVDNLVREFALAANGARSGTTAPVPAPLAELIDHVVHRFADVRLELKRQATDAARVGDAHTVVELDLPVEAADAAEEYLDALDEVDAYSRANRLLTLETPPQHRLFRRWYIGEIVKQLSAVKAGTQRPPVVPFEQRLLMEVDRADAARIAAERSARLFTVAVALSAAVTGSDVVTAVLREGAAALGATGGGVLVAADADRVSVPGTFGYDEAIVKKLREESLQAELPAAYTLRTGEAVWLETVEERDARFPALVGLEPSTVAMCAVPVVADNEIVGALRFSFAERRLFDEDERRFVLALAAETAEAMQRARLLESEREARLRLEHERESLQKLAAVGEAMLRHHDLEAILQLATDAATQISAAQFGAFFYNNVDERGEEYLLYTLSGVRREAFAGFAMPRNTAIFGPTFAGVGIVRLDDVTADPRFGLSAPYFGLPDGHLPVRSYLAVPVTLSDGEVAGGLFFGHAEAGRFTATAERLVTGVAGMAAAAIETMRSLEERSRVAAILQQSLLPLTLPEVAGAELAATYSAAAGDVGGDFYDAFALDENRWGVAIGDVRGRGPEAAALTALTRYTIRTAAVLGRRPGEVLAVLNEAMHSDDDHERFCSTTFGILEISDGGATFTYANAGHPPFAVVRRDGIDWGAPTGALIGVVPGATYVEEEVRLAAGDAVVLYTDGVSEARQNGWQFDEVAFADVLTSLRGSPAEAMAAGISQAARSFAEDAQADDSAVFVISIP